MTNSWFIIALIVLAAAGIVLMFYRKNQTVRTEVRRATATATATAANVNRDYAQEREGARVAHMSADDREWEAATLQRNRENIERAATLAEQPI
ncbi:MAG: hypothetical protein M3Q50_04845 [Chloroflexota bacterium]|nr:hypothetical protein [Chloroflexia bacterium]MDQ3225941.1 hypothetical protein [Chloroflexota bacterium]